MKLIFVIAFLFQSCGALAGSVQSLRTSDGKLIVNSRDGSSSSIVTQEVQEIRDMVTVYNVANNVATDFIDTPTVTLTPGKYRVIWGSDNVAYYSVDPDWVDAIAGIYTHPGNVLIKNTGDGGSKGGTGGGGVQTNGHPKGDAIFTVTSTGEYKMRCTYRYSGSPTFIGGLEPRCQNAYMRFEFVSK